MDTYSDTNSVPAVPEDSAGSSVSSRLQDEYEELLKYAVVVPKIDMDDLPRVLADSKRTLTTPPHFQPRETIHDSESGNSSSSSDEETPVLQRGRIITPERRKPNTEADIRTITPKTLATQQRYEHEARDMLTQSSSDSETEVVFERTVQEQPDEDDLREMEHKLNIWTRQLNSNIMEEISRLRIRMEESSRHKLHTAQSKHAGELNTARNELETMKDLLNTYEVSIERKDAVIANLTRSLQNQKEKFDTLRTFTDWKTQYAQVKQEGYGMRLASQHHNRALQRKAWRMWHSIIVDKWKRRVEKACQAKAQEVCISLTNDYESKLSSLEEKYTESRAEVMALHRERESYEENMKKAFMRGVCALNMEAMNMFHETDQPSNSDAENRDPAPMTFDPPMPEQRAQASHLPPYISAATTSSPYASGPVTIQHAPTFTTDPSTGKSQCSRPKRMTTTITANKKPSVRMGNPEVLVERHDDNSAQSSSRPSSAASRTITPQQKTVRTVTHGSGTRLVKYVK